MMSLLDFAILSFTSIFVIVDPVGLIPSFLAMTQKNTSQERIRMAQLASFITFAILILSFFFGQRLLTVFGITLPAFEIAGGIVLQWQGSAFAIGAHPGDKGNDCGRIDGRLNGAWQPVAQQPPVDVDWLRSGVRNLHGLRGNAGRNSAAHSTHHDAGRIDLPGGDDRSLRP